MKVFAIMKLSLVGSDCCRWREQSARTRATGTRVHTPRPFSNRRLLKDVPEDPLGRHPNRWLAAGLAR
jgi:hypothetical protein